MNKNAIKKNYKLHRIVAIAFINNDENKPQVNHIDGNKSNNKVDNLEWVTNLENNQHAWKTKLRTNDILKHKTNNDKRITKIKQYTLDGVLLETYNCIVETKEKYGFKHNNIVACCKGKRKSAYGYKWQYVEN